MAFFPPVPIQLLTKPQILLVKRQCTQRWSLVSSVWLQSGHRPQFSHPRFRSLSAVHSLFWMAIHAWFFTLGGAHAFQTILNMLDSINPRNCILYAEAAEYWPLDITWTLVYMCITRIWSSYLRTEVCTIELDCIPIWHGLLVWALVWGPPWC
jgi:hypothetical protein